jgi:signal peptide peptidase SppA
LPAIPKHDTQVLDQPWDGGEQVKKLQTPITKAIGDGMFAWYDAGAADGDSDGYPDAKDAYKFPHHEVNGDGRPGAANVRAVRNGLSRVDQADISDSDKAGVRAHLQHHLDAFNEKKSSQAPVGRRVHVLWGAGLAGKNLALRPEVVDVLQAALAAGEQPPFPASEDGTGEEDQPAPGVIPLYGLITPFGSFLSMLLGGGGGLDQFRARLDDAVNDPAVSHIVLDVDSPGGLVDLVPETAAEVRQARDEKPVIAVANTTAASAAYWIAAQASDLVVTPSGEVGSIGVYQMHRDISVAQDQLGIKTSLITAGKYKTEGNPYEPLNSEARTAIQDVVDELYGSFVSDVAAGRGVDAQAVRNGFGQGRTLLAAKAVQAGMADRVGTFQQVMRDISAFPSPASTAVEPAAEQAAAAAAAARAHLLVA